jgi:hypothetical protein
MNNACNISTAIALSEAGAEVVGSNPTRSIIITLGNYGIKSGLLLVVVGQIEGYKIQEPSIENSKERYWG